METEALKAALKALCEKHPRTKQDFSELYSVLNRAKIPALVCGHVKDDTLAYIHKLGVATKDPEFKEILGKLWDAVDTDTFVTPSAPKPAPRPF